MLWRFRVAVLLSLSAACAADSLVYVRIHRPLIEEHLKLSPGTESDRARLLRSLFEKSGCPQVISQEVPKETLPNLMCLLPGSEVGTIVMGAGYSDDGADAGKAQWSTPVMLPLLAESLSGVPHRQTIVLAAFAGRDGGQRGASWYVSQLTQSQRESMNGMVSLESLGLTPAVYKLGQQDAALARWLEVASHSLALPYTPVPFSESLSSSTLQAGYLPVNEGEVEGSASAFRRARIPVIGLQSVSPLMLTGLRKQAGVPDGVTGTTLDINTYEDTYRLLCVYTLYLDRNLGVDIPMPGVYAGTLMALSGLYAGHPTDFKIAIHSYNSTGQLNRYETIFARGGQDALVEALEKESERGNFRFGQGLANAVKIIVLQDTPKGQELLLAAPLPKRPGVTAARDYRFSVIQFRINQSGRGEGTFINSARLRFNKKHQLEVDEYQSQPERLVDLKMEEPSKTPAIQMASAASTPKASEGSSATPSGAAGVAATPAATAPATASAPTPAVAKESPAPVFHAQARLVQVDISVVDPLGRPVQGLSANDFTVLEDGKSQQVRAFEVHSGAAPAASQNGQPEAKRLPENTFTNRSEVTRDESLSILLLDLLNTDVPDQAFARKQMIKYLKELPRGRRLGLFLLSKRLEMVRGFTDDSATLLSTVEKILTDRSFLFTSEAERQDWQGFTNQIGTVAAPSINAPAAANVPNIANQTGMDLGSAGARTRSNNAMEAARREQSVLFTLKSMGDIARMVAGYPGRKNLVWLSGGFPIRLNPPGGAFNAPSKGSAADPVAGLNATSNYKNALRAMTTALTAARVAVYPVDVRGLQTAGVDIGVSAAASRTFAGTDQTTGYTDNLSTQSAARFNERSTGKEIAEQTGGEIFAGNDIARSIARSIEDGSSYYTFAYSPEKADSDSGFRHIQVRVNRKDVKLAYRQGYYPAAWQLSPEERKANPLIVAMRPGTPQSTMLQLTAQVSPPNANSAAVRVDYRIDINAVEFSETTDHRRHAVIDCLAVAFDIEGRAAGQASNAMDVTLGDAEYQAALRDGLPFHQELTLPAGTYTLRLGILDRGSQKVGTLDVPLLVERTQVAANR